VDILIMVVHVEKFWVVVDAAAVRVQFGIDVIVQYGNGSAVVQWQRVLRLEVGVSVQKMDITMKIAMIFA
jgi:hypothetical protein